MSPPKRTGYVQLRRGQASRKFKTPVGTKRIVTFGKRRPVRYSAKTRLAAMTKTKTKLKQENFRPDGEISESSIHIPLSGKTFRLGKLDNLLGDQTFYTNSSLRLTHSAGRQASQTIATFWGGTDMSSILTQTGLISNPIAATTIKNYKIYCKEVTSSILITNQTNDVVHLKLYDVRMRRDVSQANTNYADPVNAWTQGAVTDQAGAGNTPVYIGASPFVSSAFTTNFEVVGIKDVMIHTGGHHVHKVHSMPLKTFNGELQLQNAGGIDAKHFTHFTFAVQHGFAINDNAGTTITTASGAVDYIVNKTYTYAVMQSNNSQPIVTNSLSTTPAQEALINDTTGIAAVITKA